MNGYPPELRTPPLPTLLLVGHRELHSQLRTFFTGTLRPPLNIIGDPDLANMSDYFCGPVKPARSQRALPDGVIKDGWILKHRNERAAVSVVFVQRQSIAGDPAQWSTVLQQLQHVRDCIAQRNGRLVLAVVADEGQREVPSDRIFALRQYLTLESRCIQILSVSKPMGQPQLRQDDILALGETVLEQAWSYYQSEAARVVQKHTQRQHSSPELSTWVAFKVGMLAEFRQDWVTAVKQYQAAYSHACQVFLGNPVSVRRHVELTQVAEQVHFKLVMLLLHQHRLDDALQQFRLHMAKFRKIPDFFGPGGCATHWMWVSRQYEAAADLIRSKVDPEALGTPERSDFNPAYLMGSAAEASIERRVVVEAAQGLRDNGMQGLHASQVVHGDYVGQFKYKTEMGTTRDLADNELDAYLLSVESERPLTEASLQLLRRAFQLYRGGGSDRRIYNLGVLMAREHLAANDPDSAYKLLLQVSPAYRRDGWEQPLASCLARLRECAHLLGLTREHITYSLELASIPKVLDMHQRETMAKASIEQLMSEPVKPPVPEAVAPGKQDPEEGDGYEYFVTEAVAQEQKQPAKGKTQMRINQDFGWGRLLTLAAGFVPPDELPKQLEFGLALYSHLPAELPICDVEVEFALPEGGRHKELALREEEMPMPRPTTPPGSSTAVVDTSRTADQRAGPEETSTSGSSGLKPGCWNRYWVKFAPGSAGEISADRVIIHLSQHARVVWWLSNSPMSWDERGWPEARVLLPPFRSAVGRELALGLCTVHVDHVGALPKLQITAPRYSLVGETATVTIRLDAPENMGTCHLSFITQVTEPCERPALVVMETGEAVQGPMEITKLEKGTAWVCDFGLCSKDPGQVSTRLFLHLATSGCIERTFEVAFELPFQLTTHLATTSHSYTLMPLLPPGGPLQEAVGGLGTRPEAPPPPLLPVGRPVLLTACLQSMAPCQLRLVDVQWKVPEGEGLEASSVCSAPPSTTVRKGDRHTMLFRLCVQRPVEGLQLGSLEIKWRRCQQMELGLVPSISIGASLASAMSFTSMASSLDEDDDASAPASPPGPAVTCLLPLPRIDAARPLLTVDSNPPPKTAAGQPFSYTLDFSSHSSQPEDLKVEVRDSEGFLLSGSKSSTLTVLPGQAGRVAWRAVPYGAGVSRLPAVRVAALRFGSWVDVEGEEVYVMPAAITAGR
ncbi:unnamed protein product [Ostreobium quekettii]|uniref:Trafficking protein particle complex subunit 11 domain-containing protein n=1 Tax=Ostreobium quekettii TaxID=121088 RepID=A0A8S1JFJ6_9CHLO|nr:unnamed protein product [Ostreobium quekettii]|eukprot:evm.model.scf_1085EXC.3 EVM.evm.TU.scf_1085EXC.3   scf_1085EXC:35800-48937(+)